MIKSCFNCTKFNFIDCKCIIRKRKFWNNYEEARKDWCVRWKDAQIMEETKLWIAEVEKKRFNKL